MEYRIAVIPGDGIGPEIVTEAKKVLDRVGQVFGHTFHYTEVDMGGVSIDKYGVPLTKEALETAKNSDSVLLGAVGGHVVRLSPCILKAIISWFRTAVCWAIRIPFIQV